MSEEMDVYVIDRIEATKDDGIYVYHKGLLYPQRGYPTPEVIGACNDIKRYLVGYLKLLGKPPLVYAVVLLALFKKSFIKLIQTIIDIFNKYADQMMFQHVIKDEYTMRFTKEIRQFLTIFLDKLGIIHYQNHFPMYVSQLIEYDTAYRYRIEDIMSETTKEKLLKCPRKEIKRLLAILAQRDDRIELNAKFRALGAILRAILLIPSVKKAFRQAIEQTDIKRLQLDEIDYYRVLSLNGYKFMGREIEDRYQEWLDIHGGKVPQRYRVKNGEIIGIKE